MKTVDLNYLLNLLSLPCLLKDISFPVMLTGMAIDHRKVQPGFLFVAVKGEVFDARDKISEAFSSGAAAVFYEPTPPLSQHVQDLEQDREQDLKKNLPSEILCIPVPNLKSKISQLAGIFYENPSKDLKVIGITGTNGKTSISHFLAQAFTYFHRPCGVLGTVGNGLWQDIRESARTTGDPLEIQKTLRELKNKGAEYISMEVSSHGLVQHRVENIDFYGAIFTHLTRDHLDYHQTMENYFQAKKKLFDRPELKYAMIHIDDPYGLRLFQEMRSPAQKVLIGKRENLEGDIFLEACSSSALGTEVIIKTPLGKIHALVPLIGEFQIKNLLSVIAVLLLENRTLMEIIAWLSEVKSVRGRMEIIAQKPLVVIDYAHTPDGLFKALQAMRPYVKGALWVVFGCGGDRDRGKRPLMAEIAEHQANHVIVSSDNPRSESQDQIFEDIRKGFQNPDQIFFIHFREDAVKHACQQLGPHDGLLLAGKGHEQWELRGSVQLPIDEALWVRSVLGL